MQGQQHDFKGQARRLRTALAEMNLTVSHAAALNLIARTQGERNWEALDARIKQAAEETDAVNEKDRQFLLWLEAALRMQSYDEMEFDEVMYELLGDEDASSVNNQGLYSQLEAMLTHHRKTPTGGLADEFESLLWDLRANVVQEAMLPQRLKETNPRPYQFVSARVSVCAGSPQERSVAVDCLEWLCTLGDADILRLTKQGLCNSEASDQAAIWLRKNSSNPQVRELLEDLFKHCELTQKVNPEYVGVTVDIDEESFGHYMGVMHLREGAQVQ